MTPGQSRRGPGRVLPVAQCADNPQFNRQRCEGPAEQSRVRTSMKCYVPPLVTWRGRLRSRAGGEQGVLPWARAEFGVPLEAFTPRGQGPVADVGRGHTGPVGPAHCCVPAGLAACAGSADHCSCVGQRRALHRSGPGRTAGGVQ